MDRIWVNLKWQLINRTWQLRFAIVYFAVMDLILAVLPVSFCRYLDQNVAFLVNIVNLTYAFSMIWLLFYGMAYVDDMGNARNRELIHLAEPNPWLRLLTRLLANTALCVLCFGNAFWGSRLMAKFADEHHSYFEVTMHGQPLRGCLMFALVLPLLYHLINLLAHNRKIKFVSVPALIFLLCIITVYTGIFAGFPEPVRVLVTMAGMALVFWKAGALEQRASN